jgi:hypothetical protein
MGGQIGDATVVAAPKQRNPEDEKRALKGGPHSRSLGLKPTRLAQTEAR